MKKLGSALGSVGLLVIAAMALGGCAEMAGNMVGSMAGQAIALNISSPLPPVPTDARVLEPAADVRASLGAFSGAWQGEWGQGREMHRFFYGDMKGERRAHLLVVEEIIAPDRAKVIFSNGKSWARVFWHRMRDEAWTRTDAKFENGALIVDTGNEKAMYRLNADGTMSAEVAEPGMPLLRATLRRVNLAELRKEANAK